MIIERHQRSNNQAAFSLLELLVAAMMFAILMASISTAFFGAHKLKRTNEADLQGSHEIRRALNHLKRDLRSVTLPSTNDTTQITVSTGDTEETNTVTLSGAMITGSGANGAALGTTYFEFYTASGLRRSDQPWTEIQRVGYLVRPPADRFDTGGNELIRIITRNLLPGVDEDYSEQVLLRGVDEVIFEFWSGGEWLDYWDSTTLDPQSPEAIRMSILMTPPDNVTPPKYVQLVTPVSVQVRTNTVQSANGGGR
jgi:type II secretory pathway pseudopilin PulG